MEKLQVFEMFRIEGKENPHYILKRSNKSYCFDNSYSKDCDLRYSDLKMESMEEKNNIIQITGTLRAGASMLVVTKDNYAIMSIRPIDSYVDPGVLSSFGGHIRYGDLIKESALRELSEELTLMVDGKPMTQEDYKDLIRPINDRGMGTFEVRDANNETVETFRGYASFNKKISSLEITIPIKLDIKSKEIDSVIYNEDTFIGIGTIIPLKMFNEFKRTYFSNFVYWSLTDYLSKKHLFRIITPTFIIENIPTV